MYQRKERLERAGSQEGVLELFSLLESPDPDIVESVKGLMCENLSTSKDSKLLSGLVDYFIAVQSSRSLDVLLRVKDPHDKYLFDKINELMKNESSRYQALQLLCGLVYKQPSWLHKISQHKVMNTLFNILKTDIESPNLISALFIVVCLLPMIPSQIGSHLVDTFEVFSRLVAWNLRKPSAVPETCVLHLQIGVYSLFHRLYGMFPCNFLAYLRSNYGGRDYNAENYRIFSSFIKPMLERVRLHPLLVTASKETELSAHRWKKMAYHDIIVDCASISLDAVEGTRETLKGGAGPEDLLQSSSHFAQDSSLQLVSSQSSAVSSEAAPGAPLWSPSHACGFSTPPPAAAPPPKGDWEFKTRTSVEETLPLDHAVEAKPEVFRAELDKPSSTAEKSFPKTDSKGRRTTDPESTVPTGESDGSDPRPGQDSATGAGSCVLPAEEAREEDADREVCELTGGRREGTPGGARHDTPFCSTTQNLTDEPPPLAPTPEGPGGCREEETTYDSLGQEDPFVPPTFNRFRYFSHCGPPPEIPREQQLGKQRAFRSLSCPDIFGATRQDGAAAPGTEPAASPLAAAAAGSEGGREEALAPGFERLIPLAAPSPARGGQPLFSSLSPPELLDEYIRAGSSAYLGAQPIPIPAMGGTDWTHFDGRAPPDEVARLRGEMLLLHQQLLFERHRREVHSERNRRILGRAGRARMHSDLVDALKQQISLLEKDNQNLKGENANLAGRIQRVQGEKQQVVAELKGHVGKLGKEKAQLSSANEALRSLLSFQKEENDELRLLCQLCQSECVDLRAELGEARREAGRCEGFKRDAVHTSKQLILLQELNSHYRDRLEVLRARGTDPGAGPALLAEAQAAQLADLKQRLESKSCLLDATRGRAADLESSLASAKSKLKEQYQVMEHIKRLHQDEVQVREERLQDLRKVAVQKDVYILELHKDLEALQQKLVNMGRTQNSFPTASKNSVDVDQTPEATGE